MYRAQGSRMADCQCSMLSVGVPYSAGKLGLVLELVRCLDRHDLTTPAGNLVKLLIEGAAVCARCQVRDNMHV